MALVHPAGRFAHPVSEAWVKKSQLQRTDSMQGDIIPRMKKESSRDERAKPVTAKAVMSRLFGGR